MSSSNLWRHLFWIMLWFSSFSSRYNSTLVPQQHKRLLKKENKLIRPDRTHLLQKYVPYKKVLRTSGLYGVGTYGLCLNLYSFVMGLPFASWIKWSQHRAIRFVHSFHVLDFTFTRILGCSRWVFVDTLSWVEFISCCSMHMFFKYS